MKNISRYFSIILLIVSIGTFKSVRAQISGTQLGNFLDAQGRDFRSRTSLQNSIILAVNNYEYNYKYDYTVTMKDGSKKLVRSKIYSDPKMLRTYLVIENKKLPKSDSNRIQKIYSSQTTGIQRELGNLDIGEGILKGIPTDSCWLFKIINGPINAYSFLSLQDDGQTFNPGTIVGIQKGDGPILPLNDENLFQLSDQNADVLTLINKKNYYQGIKKYNSDNSKDSK